MQTHNVSLQEKEGQNPGPTELIGEKNEGKPQAKGHPPFLPKANTMSLFLQYLTSNPRDSILLEVNPKSPFLPKVDPQSDKIRRSVAPPLGQIEEFHYCKKNFNRHLTYPNLT